MSGPVVFGTACLVALVVLWLASRAHTKAARGFRIVSLELAGNGRSAYDLLDSTDQDGRAAVLTCLKIDNAIILGYGVALCAGGAALISWSRGAWCTGFAVAAGIAGAAAAICDLKENAALRKVVNEFVVQPRDRTVEGEARGAARRSSIAAMGEHASRAAKVAKVKFLLIAVGITCLLVALAIAAAQ